MNARLPLTLSIFFLFYTLSTNAQRIEIHANKDFSTDEIATKAWGVGGAIDLDQWVKNTTFRINFNWATYRAKNNPINPRYQRIGGGVSAFYSFIMSEKFSFQCGAEVSYSNLKHSFINDYEVLTPDSSSLKPITLLQTGSFIGIGPHVGFRYALSKRMSVAFNFIPSYLFSVGSKSSNRNIMPEYNKGIWLFPLQLGLTYQIYKPD